MPLSRWLGIACMVGAGWGGSVAEPVVPARTYQITGVAVSNRDGAPIPFCRLSATSATLGQVQGQVQRGRVAGFAGVGQQMRGSPGGFQPPAALPGELTRPNAGGPPGGRGGMPGRAGSVAQDGEVTADAAGRFVLEVPHPGLWRLVGTARGFHTQAYEEHESFFTGIALSSANPAVEVRFRLAPDASIAGLVLDEAGEPVRQAQVAAVHLSLQVPGSPASSSRFSVIENATTDDRGRYELSGLAPGNYRVRVQAQPWYAASFHLGPRAPANGVAAPLLDPSLDMVYASTWYPAEEDEESAETIVLAGGEERQADFHLSAIPAVHLLVPRAEVPPAANGRPQPQRPASVTRVSGDGALSSLVFTGGSASSWDFGGLTPGTYEIRIPGPNGQPDGEVREFEVRPGAAGQITLDASKPLTRVTLIIEGVSENEVQLVEFLDPDSGRRIVSTAPPRGRRGRRGDDEEEGDDDGEATRTVLLPPHVYTVSLIGRSEDYLTGIKAEGAQAVGSTVTIGGGSPTLTLHVANARAELSGVAHTASPAAPVAGAMVLLVPVTLGQPGNGSTVLRAQTNTDGSFSLQAVVPGKYILLAIDHGWGLAWRSIDTLTPYLSRGKAVEVRPASKLNEEIEAQTP